MDKLPEVAKRFFYECKKCEAERYHVVLAHPTPSSAKIECEVCHSKKTYKLPKVKTTKTASGTKKVRAAAGPRTLAGKRAKYLEEYELLKKRIGDGGNKYSMRASFAVDQALDHPKFGLGFVVDSQQDKIEVVFEDQIRSLVHNRQ